MSHSDASACFPLPNAPLLHDWTVRYLHKGYALTYHPHICSWFFFHIWFLCMFFSSSSPSSLSSNNLKKTSPKMSQNCQKHNFGRFEWCFWHIILCFWHFFQIQSITFRQKQVFAKILCGRKTYFFHRNSLENLSERLLKPQKNLSEKSPRKDFLPLLLPERAKGAFPENPLFLGFLKGLGEEGKKRNPEKREKRPSCLQWRRTV